MIKLVLIDFDDTLTLTEEAFFKMENSIIGKMGYPPMSRDVHLKNWGTAARKAIMERVPGIDADRFMEIYAQMMEEYVTNNEIDTISKENMQTVKYLKEAGKHLAILTSRNFEEAKHLLDKNHQLNTYIEKIYYKDIMKFHKPDPRSFNDALSDFHVKPNEVVYIGDTLNDGISAKGAGIHFIATLESGLKTKEDFASVPVDFFVEKFPEVIRYIDKN